MDPDFDASIRRRGRLAERLGQLLDAAPGLRWRSVELIANGPSLEAAIVIDAGTDRDLRSGLADRIRRDIPELADVRITART